MIIVTDENVLVAFISEKMALKYGLHPVVAKQLRAAAALHDIGKSGIPDKILNKPGKLNEQEFKIIKTHTTLGDVMLSEVEGVLGYMARKIAKYHHEWYDGSCGYWGKLTDELPVYVPIVSLADVVVALLSERVYKPAWPEKEVNNYIRDRAGKQFNPLLVDIYVSLLNDYGGLHGLLRLQGTAELL